MKNNLSITEIKESLEYKILHNRFLFYIFLYLGFIVVTSVILFFSALNRREWFIFFLGIGILNLFSFWILIFAFYYLYQCHRILKKYQTMPLVVLQLKNFSNFYFARQFYFFSELAVEDKKIVAETRAIFSGFGYLCLALEDFNQKEVYGLYDEEKNRIFLLYLKKDKNYSV